MKNYAEYSIVLDGKPVYAILEAEGYRSRVSGIIDDLLARFDSIAHDRIKVFRHTVELIPIGTFVAPSCKDVKDSEGIPDSNSDAVE